MSNSELKNPVPPQAARKPHTVEIHGHVLKDDYFWLRERENSEVIDYLKAENAYTAAVLKGTEKLQQDLYDEMLARIKETDLSVPVRRGEYYYYSRTEKGKQYPIYCRKHQSLNAPEFVFFDMNKYAEGYDFFSLGALAVSPDHRYLAYSTDISGDEIYTLSIKEIETGETLADCIAAIGSSVEWAMDNRTLFYSVLDATQRPCKIMKHILGTKAEDDVLVYHEKDEGFFVDCSKTADRRYMLIDSGSKITSEVYYFDAYQPDEPLKLIQAREAGHEYSVEHYEGKFLILTNKDAKNFRLMEARVQDPGMPSWKELIAHRPDVKLEGIEVFRNYWVIFERENGLNKMQVRDLHRNETYAIDFPEPVYNAWDDHNPEYDTDIFRYGYTSLVTPTSIYDFNMSNRTRQLLKSQEVVGGYDSSAYASERILARSWDGALVPVSLVYRRDLFKKDGSNPLLLYGYGAYGISLDVHFSTNRLSLLDRGFVFAMAHIRGGGDLGRPWYENGKMEHKQNTFRDFIACAEHVLQGGYTAKDRLVISGGSAGGMLMGAVLNMRPDLFAGAVMHVPFVDVISTMLDETLPLTVTEYDEWGNPNVKTDFERILAYSPYNHIKAQTYPPMLVTGGLYDSRVQYWEPAKWVARVRDLNRGAQPVLLKINMDAGHGGASGRYDYLKEIALDYAFMLFILGRST